MDFGDGVTVNLCRTVDSKESDNGQKLTVVNSTGLQLEEHSNHGDVVSTGNGKLSLLHPQSSIQSVEDSSKSSGAIAMPESNVSIRNMLSTYENKKKKNSEAFDPDAPVFYTHLSGDIGPLLKSALVEVEPDIQIPKKQQLPATANLQHRESISCGIEESTEELLVNSSECDEKYFENGRNYSCTDSDIEVLMSEEIIDSDWSGSNTATDELGQKPVENIGVVIKTNAPQMCSQKKINVFENIKESTDQDISVGNSRCNSLSNSEQTGKNQLLKIISEQATHIQSLESTIGRYRETYKTLLEHVDALRLTLDVKNIEDIKVKMGTKMA